MDASDPPVGDTEGPALKHRLVAASTAASEETVDAVRRRLTGSDGSLPDVVVLEGDSVVGILWHEDAPQNGNAQMAEVMDPDPAVAVVGNDWLPSVRKLPRRDGHGLIVVDRQNRLLGMLPPSGVLDVVLERYDRDLARLGGFLHDAEIARGATDEPIRRRFWHRLPWLLIGLAAAVGAAGIVGAFEARLEENIVLAFFIPAIVYLADAVGTQTETLVIRGMSVGADVRRLARAEITTGVALGVVLAALFVPVGLLLWGDLEVVMTVAVAIAVASSSATAIAMILPRILSARGADPAFGSGPLATVAQDLVSILVYFAVASWIVGG